VWAGGAAAVLVGRGEGVVVVEEAVKRSVRDGDMAY
jgi:hypothetical protein